MRPLIDFISIDDLPWREVTAPGANLPFRTKVLSTDPESGGMSLLVEYPPGWERIQEGYYDQDEELFYLDGAIETADDRFTRYSYTFRPKGQLRTRVRTIEGARSLAFFNHRPSFTPASDHGPMFRPERVIRHLNLFQMPWEAPRTAGIPAGVGRKTLRIEDDPAESLWIIAMLPHWDSPYEEWHSGLEENYVLEGSIQTPLGLMTPGSYLVHPPDAIHGPMRTDGGFLALTRATLPYQTGYRPAEHRLGPMLK